MDFDILSLHKKTDRYEESGLITLTVNLLNKLFMMRSLERILLLILLGTVSGCHIPIFTPYNINYQRAAEYNLQLGLAYLQTGDIERAQTVLFKAEQQDPRSPVVKSALGYFLASIGKSEQAQTYYLKAIELSKHSGAMHNAYGSFLCHQKRYQEAELHFLKALKDPNYQESASAYENAGLCAMCMSDAQKAFFYFHKALEKNNRLEKAWLSLAELEYQSKNYTQSEEYLNKYKQLNPQLAPNALWMSIKLALLLNQDQEARHYAILLKAQYPNSSEYKNILISHPNLIKSSNLLYY